VSEPTVQERFNTIIKEAESLADLFVCRTPAYGHPNHPHCAACCAGTLIRAADKDEFDFAVALGNLIVAGKRYVEKAVVVSEYDKP
jgi:hypothetical protein